ncbi:transporter substrate-binding domain-containing protein [Terasakiella sp. A23]|uniref:substrate-binding periplasmic protein n=1 Tax=Terasakiella sp. FCG-A23 TaxID=3080561 RepID=UPI002955A27D|nr:transporter substrate-binding domain-containing protein [Terasakiella sp. A23]MDV7339442.1 transporter substrate-binding domain-containing protein [Terasakiella sp. A23]
MNGFILRLVILVTCGVLLSSNLQAQEYEYDLVIPLNPENFGETRDKLEGPTGKILNAVIEVSQTDLSYRIANSSHGYNAFYKGKYACVAPDSTVYYDKASPYINSLPIRDTHWVAVYRKDGMKIKDRMDLVGKTVGLIYEASALRAVVPKDGVNYDYFSNLHVNLKKLDHGRLDAVVVPELGLAKILSDHSEFKNLTFDTQFPLAVIPDRVMCHDTRRGRQVIEIVNEALRDLNKDN